METQFFDPNVIRSISFIKRHIVRDIISWTNAARRIQSKSHSPLVNEQWLLSIESRYVIMQDASEETRNFLDNEPNTKSRASRYSSANNSTPLGKAGSKEKLDRYSIDSFYFWFRWREYRGIRGYDSDVSNEDARDSDSFVFRNLLLFRALSWPSPYYFIITLF
jgi:hypothetical protein